MLSSHAINAYPLLINYLSMTAEIGNVRHDIHLELISLLLTLHCWASTVILKVTF